MKFNFDEIKRVFKPAADETKKDYPCCYYVEKEDVLNLIEDLLEVIEKQKEKIEELQKVEEKEEHEYGE